MTELLERISVLHKEQFESSGITCKINCRDATLEIWMDERIIEQVLINLVKNAMEALLETPEPELTLSAWQSGGEAILAVKDNGTGIPGDQLDHIFIPFYSTRDKGSGVGLSFSQHIMRMHRGSIHVRSKQGEGTEIQLVFSRD